MKIFYYCHSHQTPRGGQKHTYRHVDILARCGVDAYVVHAAAEGYRLHWFANQTPVLSWQEFMTRVDSSEDFFVIP